MYIRCIRIMHIRCIRRVYGIKKGYIGTMGELYEGSCLRIKFLGSDLGLQKPMC